jgi:hypothetical protein
VTYSIASSSSSISPHPFDLKIFLAAAVFVFLATLLSFAQVSDSVSPNVFVVDDAPDQEFVVYGKTVIVKNQAKGALAIGGDVIVEGKVYGDVAAIGGSVIQRDGAYIGGDVFIFGGEYRPDSLNPLREQGRETVMYAGYEEELRELVQNPIRLFSPSLSLAFFAQRILSILFWFIVSLGLTTLAPGAVGRAVARFHLSPLKVVAIGVGTFFATTVGVVASLSVLPNYLNAIVGLMVFVLLVLAYFFGHVALNISLGKTLQKHLLKESQHSEALSILLGVVGWTVLLSIPYVWTIALFVLFSASIGLVLTGRPTRTWQTP